MEETTEVAGKHISYNYQRVEDKHYFGGFLNLAKNNIDEAFRLVQERFPEIMGRIVRKELKPEDIDKIFNSNLSYADWNNRLKFLGKHLQIVNVLWKCAGNSTAVIGEADRRKLFISDLKCLIKTNESLRNFYTHHYHKPISVEERLFEIMDATLLHTVLDVKKKRMKTDKTRQLLKTSLKDVYEKLIDEKHAFLLKLKKKRHNVSLTPDQIHNAVLNDAFWHMLWKEEVSGKITLTTYYKSKLTGTENHPNQIPLSVKGLTFLLCQFLTKKQGEDLRSRIFGFKGKVNNKEKLDGLKNMATHWVYSYNCYKTAKIKLTTDFDKEVLLTQLADELSKVPDEVYQTFSSAQKNDFVEDINEYIKTGNETESLEESIVIHPVIRKRYESKFNYFALRFLDEYGFFNNLRFQVHLGNYVHDRRRKDINGTSYYTERVVKERIKVFGRLSEVTALKQEYWAERLQENENWELFPNPSYNFIGNNIPIYLDLNKSTVTGSGELKTLINDARKQRDIVEKRKGRVGKKMKGEVFSEMSSGNKGKDVFIKMMEPTALLSLNELPAMLYALLMEKKTPDDIEQILISKLIKHTSVIKSYTKDNPLPHSQVTKKMNAAGDEVVIDYKKLMRSIQAEIEEGNRRKKEIAQRLKEIRKNERKRAFDYYELGQIASWISIDLIRFMPHEVRKNWRGHHHSFLQRTIAFYDTTREEARAVVENAWNQQTNPYWSRDFLNTFQKKTFTDFYDAYLRERKKVLTAFHTSVEQHHGNRTLIKKVPKKVWLVFKEREFTIRTLKNQKEAVLAKPLVFPRGIFDDKPTFIPEKNLKTNPELFADWYRYAQSDEHTFQQFYSEKRDYEELYAQEKLNDQDFIENKKNLTEQERFDLFKMKHDLKIKRVKMQDVFLNEMIKHILNVQFKNTVELKPADFYQTKIERIKNDREAFGQHQRSKGDYSYNTYNTNFIWSKTIPFEKGQLSEAQVKIKDMGKYNRFLSNEKVIQLFAYDANRSWTKAELENELELKPQSFEVIRREELLKEIQQLEREVLQKAGFDGVTHPSQFEQGANPNFKMYVVNGILRKMNQFADRELESISALSFDKLDEEYLKDKPDILKKAIILIIIRNKFAHNQLPDTAWLSLMNLFYPIHLETDLTYSNYYLRVWNSIVKELVG